MTKIISLDIGKTWPLSKHGDIILNSMSKTREKQNSIVLNRVDFWMIWRCHGILCFHFYFLFRNNGKWEQFNENDLRHCYGIYLFIYFWKCHSEIPWSQITVRLKVLSQQLRGKLTTAFERRLTVKDFTDMDQHRCRACSSKRIAPRHLTYYWMLLFFSHKPSF